MHKVLVLGAGLVSRPIVSYFIDHDGCELTVATLHIEDAQGLIDGRPGAKAVAVDVTDREQVGRLVEVATWSSAWYRFSCTPKWPKSRSNEACTL